MLGEAVKKLIWNLNKLVSEEEIGEPFLSRQGYRAYPFNVNYFKPINMVNSKRKLAFIDGGNCELIGAPNFSIQLNRIYFNIFQGKRRIPKTTIPEKIEFFSATSANFRKDQIYFDTSIFPMTDEISKFLPRASDLSFSSTDRRLMIGTSRADIARVASIGRRFAEWEYAKHIIENELDEGDILVMDGTLRAAFTNESNYAKEAYKVAIEKGAIYSGLSKTSRLYTTTGLSLLGALRKLANDFKIESIWYYYPVAESLSPEHKAAIFIVKLNDNSQRIFRYEINAEQVKLLSASDINEVMCQLSINSSDVSFPGYPYGLIDADYNARVRHEEVETYRIMLMTEISKLGSWPKFLRHIQSKDAHGILNFLRG